MQKTLVFRLWTLGLSVCSHLCAASLKSKAQSLKPFRRRGVTIIEVLFSILVTSVGLFGAIAIFPFAESQSRKARLNDAAAALGRSAVHMFDTMGMRRPFDRWYTWNGTQFVGATPATFSTLQSYCIDSRFLVRNTGNVSTTATTRAQFFPYISPLNAPAARMNRIAFFPGSLAPSVAASLLDQFDRTNTVALVAGEPAYGRNLLLADSIFIFKDDLDFIRPGIDDVSNMTLPSGAKLQNDRSLPAFQVFQSLAGGALAPRPTQGHLSWMATLVPKVDYYSGTGSDEFVLSIVVFNNRPTDLFLSANNQNVLERTVIAEPQSGDGSTGGEFLLRIPEPSPTAATEQIAKDRLKVRSHDWVMLSTVVGGVGRFQWYRVTHCDPEIDYGNNLAGNYSRYVTLMGQDWPYGNCQATLMEGVVAVYEKTIRLDNGSTF